MIYDYDDPDCQEIDGDALYDEMVDNLLTAHAAGYHKNPEPDCGICRDEFWADKQSLAENIN